MERTNREGGGVRKIDLKLHLRLPSVYLKPRCAPVVEALDVDDLTKMSDGKLSKKYLVYEGVTTPHHFE